MSDDFEEPGFLVACDVCTKHLSEPGAVLFGPPDETMKVQKYHICKKCFKHVIKPTLQEPEEEW